MSVLLARGAAGTGIVLAQRGAEARLDELRPERTDRGVTLATPDGRVCVDLVEHLLAAVGGLGIAGRLRVEVEGDELPLLDGGALRFAETLARLALPLHAPDERPIQVTRPAVFEHGRSAYRFAPGPRPSLHVEVDFPAPVGQQRATWDGAIASFLARVAPARTFGWAHEIDALRAAGRAAGVDLASVLVFDARGSIPGCRPSGPDEPARHKLLDLIGDLTLRGALPRGQIHATAPGHTATHAVISRALAEGVLA